MTKRLMNVLFLCEGNSTLSIFGEAILRRFGRGKFESFSAGSDPKDGVDEHTIDQLQRNNYDPSGLKVNDWNDYARADAPPMDFVIALSDKVPLRDHPDWPGEPLIATWHIADPANADGSEMQRKAAFVKALTELESRISIFVNLPIESLDRMKLQQSLNDIGRR
ncbi:MAG: arsenate reductase ArsC [Gammaproteobacteria bacterium]|nr:arsenate reductase ArsC [Gammaproteobacteria bacterium]